MKNKTILLLSLILIAFLIAASYTPQAVQAEEQAPETELHVNEAAVPDNQNWESLKLELDDFPTAGDRSGYFSIPGLAFSAHYSNLPWYNAGGGCMASNQATSDPVKTFVAPITIPFQSKMMKVYY